MRIFLDIDGVMVPAKGWKAPELQKDGFPAFSSKAVAALGQLLAEENVTITLTTSHKSNFTIAEWKQLFANRGLLVERLDRLPENVNNITRKQELTDWFNINSVEEDFVIIDDDKGLNDLPYFLKERLIQTSPYIGLTEEHLEHVEAIRSSKPALV